MSKTLTEEASKLRASAASTLIGNELEISDLKRQLNSFDAKAFRKSTSSEELSDTEFRPLAGLGNATEKALEQLRTTAPLVCSAVSASVLPTKAGTVIAAVLADLDTTRAHLNNAEGAFSGFKDATDLVNQRNFVDTAHQEVKDGITSINSAATQLHSLMFDQS